MKLPVVGSAKGWLQWLAVLALLFSGGVAGAQPPPEDLRLPPPSLHGGGGMGDVGVPVVQTLRDASSSFPFIFETGLGVASRQAFKMSSDEHQATLDYQLTMPGAKQLMSTYSQMARYFADLPAEIRRARTRAAMGKHPTLTEAITQLEKDPERMAICKRGGLTANDFTVGVRALRMALWLAEGMQASPDVFASPENLAFANANLAQLQPKWHALEPKWDAVEWRRLRE